MFETVIGLEIHVQLDTMSKVFCGDANQYYAMPNTNISVISLAHPGTLPKVNKVVIEKAVKLGLALNCEINPNNYFDRKNYFYPDLPKGYQITQDKQPICKRGEVKFLSENKIKSIRLHHIHVEEDAGKSSHDQHELYSLIDINRAGVPLLEIVTEPDFRSSQEVSDFLTELQKIVQYMEVSDANMEEGSFRCDCNVSVRKPNDPLGERCEIKNLNSRKFARQAIDFEANRQINLINEGKSIQKTTMLFDPNTGETRAMRKKESENDYRYFPDPDLPPLHISQDLIDSSKKEDLKLPLSYYTELTTTFDILHADAEFLVERKEYVKYFHELAIHVSNPKEAAEFLVSKLIPYMVKNGKSLPQDFMILGVSQFLNFINNDKVSKSAAYQKLLPIWLDNPLTDLNLTAQELNLIQSEDQGFLDVMISDVLKENVSKVVEYQKGKKGLLGFFVGQVMQKSEGKADPKLLNTKVIAAIDAWK